jgi:hypothetical protein
MDSSRDNAFTRFATFWWALGTFLIFGLLIAVVWIFSRQAPDTLEDLAAQARYKNKQEVFKAQEAAIAPEAIDKAIESVGKQLLASKPAALETDAQIVPGSARAKAKEDQKGRRRINRPGGSRSIGERESQLSALRGLPRPEW